MVAAYNDVFDITCVICGVTYQLLADEKDIQAWRNGEGYIQDLLAYLSPAEREMLISGTCGSCWNNLYPNDVDIEE